MKKIWLLVVTMLLGVPLMSVDLTWSAPTVISSGTQNAAAPRIGVSSSGNAVAAWIENTTVYASTLPFGGSWSAATAVSGSGVTALGLVVDLNGNATVVFLQSGVVKAATKPNAGSWGSVSTLSGSSSTSPHIAVDSAGDVVAIWERSGSIQSATKAFGGSWPVLPDTLALSGADSPRIAIGDDTNNTTVAIWRVISNNNIVTANKLIAGLWSAGTTRGTGVNPQVGVDPSGNAIATWFQYSVNGLVYSNVTLAAASKLLNQSWSSSTLVSQTYGIRNPTNLSSKIGFDANGNAVAVWNNSFDGDTFAVQLSVSRDNGLTWSDASGQTGQDRYALAFDLSTDARGDALVAIMTNSLVIPDSAISATQSDISSTTFNLGFPSTLSTGTTNNGFPRIAVRNNGSTIYSTAVWINNDGTRNNIQASSTSGTLVQPPTNLAVSQNVNNFGVFSEYYNTFTWDPSPSPHVSVFLIYRNGQLILTADSTTFQFVDFNATQNGSVTYGISCVDVDNIESELATVSFP